jgi:hypothetical protein
MWNFSGRLFYRFRLPAVNTCKLTVTGLGRPPTEKESRSMNNDVLVNYVTGPKGPLMISLPSPRTRRWFPQRKAQVVAAVRKGYLTFEEACVRYALSREEFASWERGYEEAGVEGLTMAARNDAHRMQSARFSGASH